MTLKGNTKPRDNPPNPVPNVPADTYSDPRSSYYYFSESSDSSDDEYYKQRRCAKKDKNKCWGKTRFDDPIKKCAKLTAKLLIDAYKSKVVRFKLD